MGKKRLILASQSQSRQAMLRQAGVHFDICPADIDEERVKKTLSDVTPDQIALKLAAEKALAVSKSRPGSLVIGSDQVLVHRGRILSKPGNRAGARDQLLRLKGESHQLIAAVVLAEDGKILWQDLDQATLNVRDFSDAFLQDYLDRVDETAFYCVGSYQLESLGIQIFNTIDGNYFTILGMPLLPLLNRLRNEGLLQS